MCNRRWTWMWPVNYYRFLWWWRRWCQTKNKGNKSGEEDSLALLNWLIVDLKHYTIMYHDRMNLFLKYQLSTLITLSTFFEVYFIIWTSYNVYEPSEAHVMSGFIRVTRVLRQPAANWPSCHHLYLVIAPDMIIRNQKSRENSPSQSSV